MTTFFKETTTISDSNTSKYDGPFTLVFNLACGSSSSYFHVSPTTTPRLLRRENPPHILACVLVDLDEFEDVKDLIDLDIEDWPLPLESRMKFIDAVMEKAEETTRSMPSCNNMVHINAQIDVSYVIFTDVTETVLDVTETVPDENDQVIELLAQLSMEESSYGMTPATESAIESLEKKKYTCCDDKTDDCSICLDEFSVDSDVTSMPCSHIFHWDCIQSWLRTSRYCPLCRFEMPTSDV